MKVALVHYWLVGMRGGERVLEQLCEIYPDADIYTLVLDKAAISSTILQHRITTSFLQAFGGKRLYKFMLPLMPMALESFDLTSYDLIISSESGPAKGIIPGPDAIHICYCHSPMRYIWDLYPQYYAHSSRLGRLFMTLTASRMRQWDVTTSSRVDYFIANSHFVSKRIKKYYRRDSAVINPPVDLSRFSSKADKRNYYLCAGQVTPNKRIDLAIQAFNQLSLPLLIIGGGVNKHLRRLAGSTIEFLGPVDDTVMTRHIAEAKALIFPGVEDFGIVPLEAIASGTPVIAYAKGGALETVEHGSTGIHFSDQTVESLTSAVRYFESTQRNFDSSTMRSSAERFSPEQFQSKLRAFVDARLAERSGGKRQEIPEDCDHSINAI